MKVSAKDVMLSNGLDLESVLAINNKLTTQAKVPFISAISTRTAEQTITSTPTQLTFDESSNRLANVSDAFIVENNIFKIKQVPTMFSMITVLGILQISIANSSGSSQANRLFLTPRYYANEDTAFENPIEFGSSSALQMNIESVGGTRNHLLPVSFRFNLDAYIGSGFDFAIYVSVDRENQTIKTARTSPLLTLAWSDQFN